MENHIDRKGDRRAIHDRRIFSYYSYFPERRMSKRRQFIRRKDDKT